MDLGVGGLPANTICSDFPVHVAASALSNAFTRLPFRMRSGISTAVRGAAAVSANFSIDFGITSLLLFAVLFPLEVLRLGLDCNPLLTLTFWVEELLTIRLRIPSSH